MIRSALLVAAAMLMSTQLQAKTCELSIDSTDQMTFTTNELKVAADCTEVKLTLNHVGQMAKNVMGHNWVLTKTADYMPVAQDGMKAGADNDYLVADDARIIAHTALIGGGESATPLGGPGGVLGPRPQDALDLGAGRSRDDVERHERGVGLRRRGEAGLARAVERFGGRAHDT